MDKMNDLDIIIPEILLTHAQERNLVVMAGAGVSAVGPSFLPGWKELNRMIVAALCHRLDTYLGFGQKVAYFSAFPALPG
ncbi:MAG: hypothetical protein P8175_15895 [Deltaproteobacteria bacterium]